MWGLLLYGIALATPIVGSTGENATRLEEQDALRERMESLGIEEDDLVEKFVLGTGSGGQKINKTSSCVYLKHTPTGFEVKCQRSRRRELNRFLARRELCDRIRAAGAIAIVDGVSFAPHGLPDIPELGADVYFFSLYKVYGPHLGVMVLRRELNRDLPYQGHFFNEEKPGYRFTPAGPDHAQIAAVNGVIDYLEAIYAHHSDTPATPAEQARVLRRLFRARETELLQQLLDFLSGRERTRLIGKSQAEDRAPTVAFSSDKRSSHEIAAELAKMNIGVGAGDFYAYRLVQALGYDMNDGVVRASFVHYTAPPTSGSFCLESRVVEYHATPTSATADPAPVRTILTLDQPRCNHNAGSIFFGTDGYLYIPFGDGGANAENGQDPKTWLGTILRLDIDSAVPYAIPPDNPYNGTNGAREVWATGLRNPYRSSVDRVTGDLYIGDVGQNAWEEVSVGPAGVAGLNYGWNTMEGTAARLLMLTSIKSVQRFLGANSSR